MTQPGLSYSEREEAGKIIDNLAKRCAFLMSVVACGERLSEEERKAIHAEIMDARRSVRR